MRLLKRENNNIENKKGGTDILNTRNIIIFTFCFSLPLDSLSKDPKKWDYTYKSFMIDFVDYLNKWISLDEKNLSLQGFNCWTIN